MNAPVDVLAVLQRQIDLALSYGNDERAEALQDIRAAIAELMNLVAYVAAPQRTDVELFDTMPDLRAALARVGGGK